MNYTKLVIRNALVYKKEWRGAMLFSFLNPLLFLTAMGLGLGSLVNSSEQGGFGGVSYLAFFATGMLPATCMNAATFEGAWPIHSKFNWTKNYEAMLAAPLQVKDLYFGELGWLTVRMFIVSVPFFLIMAAFGVVGSAKSLLAIPIAVLFGNCIGAAVIAYSATIQNDSSYNGLFRFVITPLFLFSGTFFPLESVPTWMQKVAAATPLYHAIQLVRGVTIQSISGGEAVWHLVYLFSFLAIASSVSIWRYNKKLVN